VNQADVNLVKDWQQRAHLLLLLQQGVMQHCTWVRLPSSSNSCQARGVGRASLTNSPDVSQPMCSSHACGRYQPGRPKCCGVACQGTGVMHDDVRAKHDWEA
jgi:hypothetical protein